MQHRRLHLNSSRGAESKMKVPVWVSQFAAKPIMALRIRPVFRVVALSAVLLAFSLSSAVIAAPRDVVRVSIDARNEPVQAVLIRIARISGVSVSVGQGITGYVTVSLHHVALAEALRAVLAPLGDTYHRDGAVYHIEPATNANVNAVGGIAPTVLPVSVISVKRAAEQLRGLFPQSSIREDARANALLVIAPPNDVQSMRSVLQGIDVRNPTERTTEALSLRTVKSEAIAAQLRHSFSAARISTVGTTQLLITATPQDLMQIKAAVGTLDTPLATPPPAPIGSDAVRVTQRRPSDVARALAAQVSGLKASVSGSTVVLVGPQEAIARAKALIVQLDVPSFDTRYTAVYHILRIDAGSVADLLRRSFRDIEVTVDASINAIAVSATAAQQQRIADAIAQLDPAPATQGLGGAGSFAGSSTELVTLKSAMPGPTTGGVDAVTAMTQALQIITPDVKVVPLPTPGQVALVGPAQSIRLARDFITKVDVVAPEVVLDTEVLELDENVAKNLGIELGTAVLSTSYTEATPPPAANGVVPLLGGLGKFGRTPLTFTAQLNLAISNGRGRVLADPRITTLSGRTASIRAGDTISILTTTAGNAGTIATTQVQSFQTGVTLDITPLVDAEGGITVALHPVVNSLIGVSADGVPEISTRDTQTTVHLRDNETLVIGGLIQENDTRTTTKIPILSDIPLLGRVFRNESVTNSRNELVIVVTPHLVIPGSTALPGPPLSTLPTAQPLPTLPPNTKLPSPSGLLPRASTTTRGSAPPSTALATPAPVVAATPAPAPSAFAQTDVFTFGSAPQSNFAKSSDPVQLFYATLSPTIVSNGTSVHAAVITTTNATAVKLQIGSQTISLAQTGPGRWQATFPFPLGSVPSGQTTVVLSLVATRNDGTSATLPIPVNVGGT